MADWIEEGLRAPNFTLTSDDGKTVVLRDLRGLPVVLYFYPKDDTPGCTAEACAFRDRKAEMDDLGVVLLGISPDTTESHAKFREKYGLNFCLLSDPDHTVSKAFGAWRDKVLYGKRSRGIQRSTYLLDADGRVVKVWRRVKVAGHDEQVLEALKALKG